MDIQKFREEKARAYSEMRDLMKRDNGSLTADEQAQYEKAEADWQAAQRSIERLQKFQKMAGEQGPKKPTPPDSLTKTEIAKKKREAFVHYIRGGFGAIPKELRQFVQFEQRGTDSQATTPDSAGGYLIDSDLAGEINLGREFVSDIEMACTVLTTPTGKPLNYPKIDDTATDGAQYSEASRNSTAIPVADITVGNTVLNAYFYSSKWVKMTLEAVQDIEYSFNSFLLPTLGARVRRAMNPAFTTGNGSGAPNGIVTASGLGVTAAAVNAITHEELIDLFYAVDKYYRDSAKFGFMMNDTVEKQILKLGLIAAENFNPIVINPNTQQLSIMGKPVYSNSDMASTIEASAKTILAGDFSQYVIRKVASPALIVSQEQFIQHGQYGYMAYVRADSDFVGAKSNSIVHLIQAAS